MATTAQTMAPSNAASRPEKVVDFSPSALRSPFFLRCAALFIDYMVLLAVPLGWLTWERFFGDAGVNAALGSTVWLIGNILWLINFLLLPLLRGQTIGKMLTGQTIVNLDGTPIRLSGVIRRHIFGFLLTGLTLGLGFLASAFTSTGRALHDLVGGTIVVRGRKKQL